MFRNADRSFVACADVNALSIAATIDGLHMNCAANADTAELGDALIPGIFIFGTGAAARRA